MVLRILVRGWTKVPHSYACVNCYQLYQMKRMEDEGKIALCISEEEYYSPKWNDVARERGLSIYPRMYRKVLESIKVVDAKECITNGGVDIVYSIVYPYNVEVLVKSDGAVMPKCVFYTAEFAQLTSVYFTGNIENIQKVESGLFFTSPSEWSAQGLRGVVEPNRNVTISHGIDDSVYFQRFKHRQAIRAKYGVDDTDVLLVNMGGMTGNKGIKEILCAMNLLSSRADSASRDGVGRRFKLLLKSISDLYLCVESLKGYTKDFEPDFIKKHVIIIDQTLSTTCVNELFNACDLYISPYSAEGFNLMPLEALCAGLPLVITRGGSTDDYILPLLSTASAGSNADKFITELPSQLVTLPNVGKALQIQFPDLANCIVNAQSKCGSVQQRLLYYPNFIKEVTQRYHWGRIATQLVSHLEESNRRFGSELRVTQS